MTSSLVAGVLDTYCTQSWLSSVHSLSCNIQVSAKVCQLNTAKSSTERAGAQLNLGGRIEFSMSSVCGTSDFCSPGSRPPVYSCAACSGMQDNKNCGGASMFCTLRSFSLLFFSLVLLTSTALSYLTRDCKGGIMSTDHTGRLSAAP